MWSRFFQSLEVTMLAVILGNHVRHHSTLFCDPVPPLHAHTITHTHTHVRTCVFHPWHNYAIIGSRTSEVLDSLYLWRASDQQLWKSCSAACKRWFMPWACREHDMFNWVPRVSQPHQSKLHCGHWEQLWTILWWTHNCILEHCGYVSLPIGRGASRDLWGRSRFARAENICLPHSFW